MRGLSDSKLDEREDESESEDGENDATSVMPGRGLISNLWSSFRSSEMNLRKIPLSFLYLALIGCGYAAFDTFPALLAYVYLGLGGFFTAVVTWILLDLQRHPETAIQTDTTRDEEDEKTDDGTRHFLCGNPLCERCAGYYGGLGATAGTSLKLHEELVTAFGQAGVNPWIAIILGFGIFTFTTPVHGALKSMMRALLPEPYFERTLDSDRVKLLVGLISGLSLSIAVIGSLMLLPE